MKNTRTKLVPANLPASRYARPMANRFGIRSAVAGAVVLAALARVAIACSSFDATGDGLSSPSEAGDAPIVLTDDASDAGGQDARSSCDGPCVPVTLIDNEAVPSKIAVRAGSVYWVTEAGAVRTCRVDACATTIRTIAAGYPKAGMPGGIAVGAKNVYWTVYLNSVVFRAPIDGVNATPTPYPAFANGYFPVGIVVDSARVYWTTESPDEVRSCPTTGGCTADASTRVADGGYAFTRALAQNDTHVFWLTGDGDDPKGIVFRAAKSGGAAEPLRYDTAGPRGIAVRNNSVFVTSWLAPSGAASGVVFRIVSATSVSVLASAQPEPSAIVADETNVYWTNLGDGTIRRCAIAGCDSQATILAKSQGTPESLADDETAIYWADTTNGKIVRLSK